jgi:magnesium-protoporphyrin O-methyltransferase
VTPPSDADIASYFDGMVDCCAPRRDPTKRPAFALARLLLDALKSAGVSGKSVLELGCGRGELSAELIRAGAARVTGVDLSSDSIAVARRLAVDEGLTAQLELHVGNAAAPQQMHDVVVHHRVICCYSDATELLHHSIEAASHVYGYSMPRSAGLVGASVRGVFAIENIGHRLRGRGFRSFAHDERLVDAALRAAGFRLVRRANQLGWFAAAYVR